MREKIIGEMDGGGEQFAGAFGTALREFRGEQQFVRLCYQVANGFQIVALRHAAKLALRFRGCRGLLFFQTQV